MRRSGRVAGRARRWLVASLVIGTTIAGCNVIFGIEQHEPFPPGGGGAGGSSGTAGGGGTTCSSATECPGEDTTCAQRTCEGGQCGIEPAGEDTPCTEAGGQVCDGEGQCVECNSAAQCDTGETCQQHLCVSLACANDVKDGNETDVDCGGGDCPPCQNTEECLVYSDCQSRFCDTSGGGGGSGGSGTAGVCAPCTDDNDCAPVPNAKCDVNQNGGECVDALPLGAPCSSASSCVSGNCPSDDSVCCDEPCHRQCEACLGAKTGGSDGTCGPVSASSDPDSECSDAPGACGPDGTGCNGAANDPHCNGAQCTCVQQYTHADIIEVCGQTNTECTLRVDVMTVDCATICQAGGGECLQFRNDNPNFSCGLGAAYACTYTGFASAICICSRGCDGDPACVTPFTCTGGDCL